jgi:hypothetical protein
MAGVHPLGTMAAHLLETHRVKRGRTSRQVPSSVSVGTGEEISDTRDGHRLIWTAMVAKARLNVMLHKADQGEEPDDPTVYTVTNRRYFPGTIALLNSLRLTGHTYPAVVLDAGLEHDQRRLLEPHCQICDLPESAQSSPLLRKPFPYFLQPAGVVLFLDSDMIVTGSLEPFVLRARRGEICAVLDPNDSRWHPDWQTLFELREPLRREPYVNTGFLAFSTLRWPDLIERWWRACQRIPSEGVVPGRKLRGEPADVSGEPLANGDQDAFNAIVMSEVPAGAVTVLSRDIEAFVFQLRSVRIVEEARLRCERCGHPTMILHYNGDPKPWEWRAWARIRDDAYVRLFRRVMVDHEGGLRLPPRSIPAWLAKGPLAWIALRSLETCHRAGHVLLRKLPTRATGRLRHALRRVIRW